MKKPTTAELEILNVLWDRGPISVRDVHNLLAESRDVFYTTTLKTMQVMLAKGYVSRDTSERAHIYQSAIARSDVERDLIDGLLNGVFKGSSARLIVSALGAAKPSRQELDEIRDLLDNMES